MSIQLSLNGLSFCAANTDGIQTVGEFSFPVSAGTDVFSHVRNIPLLSYTYAQTNIVLDTDRACLIPAEFSGDSGDDVLYLTANGIRVPAEHTVVASVYKGIKAVMVFPCSAYEYFGALQQDRIRYVHPQQLNLGKRFLRKTVLLNLGSAFVHCTVFNPEPCYSETLPLNGSADLLFYLQQLGQTYNLADFRIVFAGCAAQTLQKEIRRYFKQVSLSEMPPVPCKKIKAKNLFEFNNLLQLTYEDYQRNT